MHANQSVDFHCKSIDWFLYDSDIALKFLNLQKENYRRIVLYSHSETENQISNECSLLSYYYLL